MMIHTQQVAFIQGYKRRKCYGYHNGVIEFQGNDTIAMDRFSGGK